MENPFETIIRRLNQIEDKVSDIQASISEQRVTGAPSENRLVKIDAAAEITGYSKNYIYDLVNRNIIPFVKFGNMLRFDPAVLDS